MKKGASYLERFKGWFAEPIEQLRELREGLVYVSGGAFLWGTFCRSGE
jgi:hypothetical protein